MSPECDNLVFTALFEWQYNNLWRHWFIRGW